MSDELGEAEIFKRVKLSCLHLFLGLFARLQDALLDSILGFAAHIEGSHRQVRPIHLDFLNFVDSLFFLLIAFFLSCCFIHDWVRLAAFFALFYRFKRFLNV